MLLALQDSFYTLLGCLGLLLIALLLVRLVLRKEPRRLWQRKPIIFLAAMNLLALISAVWTWFAYQSFAHYGLPPSAGYYDWYERFGQDIADQLDSAVGGFGTWSILFSIATLALLCVVGGQVLTSLRTRRRTSR
jgi:hypothetical protein